MITIIYDDFTHQEDSLSLTEAWLKRRGYRKLWKTVWRKQKKSGFEYAYIRF